MATDGLPEPEPLAGMATLVASATVIQNSSAISGARSRSIAANSTRNSDAG